MSAEILDLDGPDGYQPKRIRLGGKDWELPPVLPVLLIAEKVEGETDPAKMFAKLLPVLREAWPEEFIAKIGTPAQLSGIMAVYGLRFDATDSPDAVPMGESPASSGS